MLGKGRPKNLSVVRSRNYPEVTNEVESESLESFTEQPPS